MAQQQQNQMPSSFGGLVRYFDEDDQSFQLDPKVVVASIVGVISVEIMAKFYLAV